MRVTATELNKHPGACLNEAIREPVIIEKTGRPTVVMVSYERYIELEGAYWGEQAIKADQEKSLSKKKSLAFLESDD